MLMTLENAELRLLQSQMLLDQWVMLGSGEAPEASLKTITQEIRTLEALADQYDHLTERIATVLTGWQAFRQRTRMRCN